MTNSENLLNALSVDFPFDGEYREQILQAEDPSALFTIERHMTDNDFNVIRREASRCNTDGKFDVDAMLEDFKVGIIFIELFYAQIYHNDRSIEERPDQIRGSKAMYFNSYFKGNMLGEYPTGSGKSFMYLIFAAAAFYVRKESTTIVTSGISLQEQLDAKDMPFISNIYKSITGQYLNYGLMKGRQNYICNKRYDNISKVVNAGHKLSGVSNTEHLKEYVNSVPFNFNGDMSNITISPDMEVRRALTVKSSRDGGCKKCEMREKCYYIKAQMNVIKAAIKVINYHLLFTEIEKIRKLGYLSGDSNNYVFDEAHEISNIGRDFSERTFNKYALTSIKGQLTGIDNRIGDTQQANSPLWGNVSTDQSNNLIDSIVNIFAGKAASWFMTRKGKYYDDVVLDVDDFFDVKDLVESMTLLNMYVMDQLDTRLDRLGFETIDAVFAANESSEGDYEDALAILEEIDQVSNHVSDLITTLRYFEEDSYLRKSHESSVVWLDKDKDDRFGLHVKNIEIPILKKSIFDDRTFSSVSVSATLSTNSTFKFYKGEVMLSKTSFEIIGPSPFDLKSQELWYIPKNARVGSKATPVDEYMDLCVDNISEVLEISQGGMLALFTSVRAMRAAYSEIIKRFPHLSIYIQGEKPRKHLVADFRDDVNSVLFATRSFFTGVDIKGPSLRVLVLDKLPFDNPSDPIVRTLSGRHNGFTNYSIPSMVMVLKQIFGRGVRSKRDKCMIMIMDKRLKTAGYAGQIRATFDASGNASSRTHDIERVRGFLGDFMSEYGEETFKSARLINDNLDFLK